MRIIYLTLWAILTTQVLSFAQTTSPVHKAVERMLEEKVRNNLPVTAMLEWQQQHPGQPFPAATWQSTITTVYGREADAPVSANPEAESEVHAAINPADSSNIIVSGIVQDANNPLNPLDIPIRYTTNFGQTWQTSSVDFSPGGGLFAIVGGGGDPVIAFDKSGTAYISWLVLTIDIVATPPVVLALYASKSTNKGQTWSTPTLIDKGEISIETLLGTGTEPGDLVDKQWMAIDRTSGSNEGALYVSYTRFEIIDSVNATAQILLKKKAKNSNAFSAQPVQIHANTYAIVQFSSIAVDQNGAVHVSFFGANSPNDGALYHTVSTDGGLSFSPEKKVSNIFFPSIAGGTPSDTIPGVNSDRLYPCPHIAVGKTANTVYATWSSNGLSSNTLTPGYDVWFAKSTNNGQTWGTPKKVNPGTDASVHQFYPAIYVNDNGTICLSYYDRSDAQSSANTHYAITTSTDEGATFKPTANVSSQPSDFAEIGSLNGGFGIGEYTQVVATKHFAIPVWADGRTNDGNIDLYAAFVPITGGSDTYEWANLTDAFSMTFPNPSTPSVQIVLTLKKTTPYTLQIVDAQGKQVATAIQRNAMPAGAYPIAFDLPTGQYFVRVETDFGAAARKLTVANSK